MGKKKSGEESDTGGELIAKPHPHDVLCGRGGLTNQHTGNEWFRRLVRSNRPLYRSCPKHTKLLVAKAIVQAVQQQEPAGRFLELADRNEGLWRQISYKRSVDKTSQALREKDPPVAKGGGGASVMPAMDPPLQVPDNNIQTEAAAAAKKAAARKGNRKEEDLSDLAQATLKQAGFIADKHQKVTPASAILPPPVDLGKKRKPAPKPEFIKPSWWGRSSVDQTDKDQMGNPNKKMKTDDSGAAPPPLEPLQTRQSSLFRFLSNTSIFGGNSDQQQSQQQQQAQQSTNNFFSFNSGNTGNDPSAFQNNRQFSMQVPPPPDQALQQIGSSTFLLDPLPINGQNQNRQNSFGAQQPNQQRNDSFGSQPDQIQQMQRQMQERMQQMQRHMQQQMQMQMEQLKRQSLNGMRNHNRNNNNANNNSMMMNNNMPRNSLRTSLLDDSMFNNNGNPQAGFNNNNMQQQQQQQQPQDDDTPLPVNRLTTQVSDWLTSFWPLGKDPNANEQQQQAVQQQPPPAPPAPPADNLERSVSSTLINFARSPSQFLSNLRSGVSNMFGDDSNNNNNPAPPPPASAGGSFPTSKAPVIGTASAGGSLLDDYEESPMETRLRAGISG